MWKLYSQKPFKGASAINQSLSRFPTSAKISLLPHPHPVFLIKTLPWEIRVGVSLLILCGWKCAGSQSSSVSPSSSQTSQAKAPPDGEGDQGRGRLGKDQSTITHSWKPWEVGSGQTAVCCQGTRVSSSSSAVSGSLRRDRSNLRPILGSSLAYQRKWEVL